MRDANLIKSAIFQPKAMFNGSYLHKSILDKAAAYLFHICQAHSFIDGNKRTALVSALVFLKLNGCSIDFEETEMEKLVMQTASSEIKKEQLASGVLKISKTPFNF